MGACDTWNVKTNILDYENEVVEYNTDWLLFHSKDQTKGYLNFKYPFDWSFEWNSSQSVLYLLTYVFNRYKNCLYHKRAI